MDVTKLTNCVYYCFKVDVEGAVVGVPGTRQTRCLNGNSLEQMGATGNRPKENRSVEY